MSDFKQDSLERALAETARVLDAPGRIRISGLLGESDLELLDRRYIGGFSREVALDGIDLLAVGLAGAVAAAIDILLVAIPKDVTYLGTYPQEGGVLTRVFKSWTVASENHVGRAARVPFDVVADTNRRVPGMFAGNHRFMTPGHDPLLGLIVGVHDILRGGRTAIGVDGVLRFDDGFAEPCANVAAALAREFLHLVSDVATKAGLPAPMMTAAGMLRVGAFGSRERTIADLARYMYESGYDLRHFVAACSAPVAIRVLLTGYFLVRRFVDAGFDADVAASARRNEVAFKHPRLATMVFIADSVACAANAGKIALYAGNPSALNYGQWLAFFRSALSFVATKLESPTEILIDRATANEADLRRRWREISEQTGMTLPDASVAF